MFQKMIDRQYRRPTGLLGRWIGQKMIEQHQPENLWTVKLLDVQLTDQILEIGFGGGFAIQEIVKHLTTGVVTGIDFSHAMVRAATDRNRKAVRAGRVKLHHGDAANVPFTENTFDKVFSIHSIYFWTQPAQVMREVWRVLKPGGICVFTLLPTERWGATLGIPAATAEFTPYGEAELYNLLSGAGFTNLRIETDHSQQNRSNYSIVGEKVHEGIS